MSAFAVGLSTDGRPLAPEALDGLKAVQAPFGGDSHATWHQGPIALVQHLRHDTPQSRGAPIPLHDPTTKLSLVADARLDNRAELATALGFSPAERHSLPDSAFILRAYDRWGTDCPRHLLGDFAFALWDARRQTLFCARDYIGARPFYYHHAAGRFLAGSDGDALLAGAGLPRAFDLPFVRASLQYIAYAHATRTAYTAVRKLPPAHMLVIADGHLRITPYWQPGQVPEIRYPDTAGYVAHLRQLLDEAVATRLRSNYPVGAHMSGGIDSTTVAVLAARQVRPGAFTAFSWAPSPAALSYLLHHDERPRIDAIAAAEGIDLCYTDLTAGDVLAHDTRGITANPGLNLYFEQTTARLAADRGVRTLLSGWGGDEFPAFNGRGYFSHLFLRGRWRTLQREVRLRAERFESSLLDGWREVIVWPLLPDVVLRHLTRGRALALPRPLPACLQPDFAAALNQEETLVALPARERPGVRRMQRRLLAAGHLTAVLESWAALGLRLGLEYGYPLLDRRIVEFCLAIPDHLYFKNGWKRYIFRRLAQEILPEDTVWKLRKDDPAMYRLARSTAQRANALLLDTLLQRRETIAAQGLVDPDCLYNGLLTLDADNPVRQDAERALPLAFVGGSPLTRTLSQPPSAALAS